MRDGDRKEVSRRGERERTTNVAVACRQRGRRRGGGSAEWDVAEVRAEAWEGGGWKEDGWEPREGRRIEAG